MATTDTATNHFLHRWVAVDKSINHWCSSGAGEDRIDAYSLGGKLCSGTFCQTEYTMLGGCVMRKTRCGNDACSRRDIDD